MSNGKSLGMDGLSLEFYKQTWSFIATDLLDVLNFDISHWIYTLYRILYDYLYWNWMKKMKIFIFFITYKVIISCKENEYWVVSLEKNVSVSFLINIHVIHFSKLKNCDEFPESPTAPQLESEK